MNKIDDFKNKNKRFFVKSVDDKEEDFVVYENFEGFVAPVEFCKSNSLPNACFATYLLNKAYDDGVERSTSV
jgi:hypothetical protein